MSKTLGVAGGTVLILVGLFLLVMVPFNLSAQMDRVDREGLGGNIFAPDVLPLGGLGLLAIVIGVAVLTYTHRRGQRPTAADG
ncbi:hypothetical protein BOH66_02555 [Microbacterium aurum]|uniref:DUF3185 domain-containing protein n=1 Tax=Microbacterium aurum TaxID=36805 RepID=A0A1P8U597_9MICO|nr:hypothetical protein [Microbacterium aurum]APZ33291.1 hypothetical protein BOH66_02555 [Microbacterium aurum]MBM7826909.1 uncharacterized protein YjeT (DUF2065 family) [Microbacterium aurum]